MTGTSTGGRGGVADLGVGIISVLLDGSGIRHQDR
jgi:hypothetical protein